MNRIEIFRPGKFKAMNGTEVSFSAEMLKDIAESYDPKVYQAPLVIGHPKVEDPAYGWVKNLCFSGERLSAEPEAVVEEFASLVSARRYQNVSASFFTPEHPANPKPGKYYLKHVGFLGAVPPAVTGLKTVSFADNDDKVVEFSFEVPEEDKTDKSLQNFPRHRFEVPQEDETAEKQSEDKTAEFAAKEEALLQREKALVEKERQMRRLEFSAFIDDRIKEGKVLASNKDGLVNFMEALDGLEPASFSAEKQMTPLEFFQNMVKNQPKIVEFGEVAGNDVEAPETVDNPVIFAEKIAAFCAEQESKGIILSPAEAAERLLGGKK